MISSILLGKCPRCRKGNLFVDKNPYHFKNLSKMHATCPCCQMATEPEPGFYYGAMYVSYGLGVSVFIANFILLVLVFPVPDFVFIATNTLLLLSLWPFIFRIARMVYLNLFEKYDPHAGDKYKTL